MATYHRGLSRSVGKLLLVPKNTTAKSKPSKSKPAKKTTPRMKDRYVIRDYEAGNTLDEFSTLTDARKMAKNYIKWDKQDGIYKPGFYEIYDRKKHETIERF